MGVPDGHPLLASEAFIDAMRSSSSSGSVAGSSAHSQAFSWPFETAFESREAVVVQGDDFAALAATLPRRAWGEAVRGAVVVPILTEAGNAPPQAFLVVGLNPRSTFGDRYSDFTQIVARVRSCSSACGSI